MLICVATTRLFRNTPSLSDSPNGKLQSSRTSFAFCLFSFPSIKSWPFLVCATERPMGPFDGGTNGGRAAIDLMFETRTFPDTFAFVFLSAVMVTKGFREEVTVFEVEAPFSRR